MEYMDAVLGNGAFYIIVLVFSFLHECVHAFAAARAGGGGRMGLRGLFGNVLYLEPGLSWHFGSKSDSGLALETVWSGRPLNFQLNAGVRFYF